MDKKGQHEFKSRFDKIHNIFECDQFFICGAPKSGTTWFQRLLDAHPEIVCSGEGHFSEALILQLSQLIKQYNKQLEMAAERVYEGRPYYKSLGQDDLEFIARTMIGLVMSQRAIPAGTKCVGDKTPRYTFQLNMLAKIFPQARFIHVVRDGRDVITSTCHHAYRTGQRAVVDKTRPEYFAYTEHCSKVWVNNVQSAESFGQKHPEHYHIVKYEDMNSEPEVTLTSTLQFLNVSTDIDMVKECISRNEFNLFSGGREKGEEDKNSYFRKGASGDWKNFLTNSALKKIYANAGDLLKRLGYLDNGD